MVLILFLVLVHVLIGQVESSCQTITDFPIDVLKYLIGNSTISTVLLLDYAACLADNHGRLVIQVRIIIHHVESALMVANGLLQR